MRPRWMPKRLTATLLAAFLGLMLAVGGVLAATRINAQQPTASTGPQRAPETGAETDDDQGQPDAETDDDQGQLDAETDDDQGQPDAETDDDQSQPDVAPAPGISK